MITVRKYFIHPPKEFNDSCREQFFLENKLWNTLVQIEREHTAKYQALFLQDTEYKKLSDTLDTLNIQIDTVWEMRKKIRSKTKSKQTDEEKELIGIHKPLIAKRKEIYGEISKTRKKLKPALKDQIKRIDDERKENVKIARQSSGLFWCNYNAIIDDYNAARSKAIKENAELQFHKFDGSGRFVNQIINGISVDDFLAGKSNQVQITDICRGTPTNFRKNFCSISFTAFTGRDENGKHYRKQLNAALYLHRPLPKNARIKGIEIYAKKVAFDLKWSVSFILDDGLEPLTELHHPSRDTCGLNLGWRITSQGIRLCTICKPDFTFEHIHMPDRILHKFSIVEGMQGEIKDAENLIRDEINSWNFDTMPEEIKTALEKAKASKSPSKLLKLNRILQENEPICRGMSASAILANWVVSHIKAVRIMENTRNRALNARKYFYQTLAKRIADSYSLIGIGQLDLKEMALLVKDNGDENELHALARATRQKVGLYELKEWLAKMAVKTGAQIVEVDIPVTKTCHSCGSIQDVPGEKLYHTCTNCGETWDRDENAALNAFADRDTA